jgi:GNAT superfamily N-acetyltransferase
MGPRPPLHGPASLIAHERHESASEPAFPATGARPASELSRVDRAALERHFLALDAADRRLRFGIPLSDTAIRSYVEHIDFDRDAVFGVFDDDLNLLAAAHLARAGNYAELGVSVLPAHRNRGLAGALLARASLRARNWGVPALFMHCLRENEAMMHLARKQGMAIVTEAGESDAWLRLAPGDASSFLGEVFAQGVALFDLALKAQLAQARRLAVAFSR